MGDVRMHTSKWVAALRTDVKTRCGSIKWVRTSRSGQYSRNQQPQLLLESPRTMSRQSLSERLQRLSELQRHPLLSHAQHNQGQISACSCPSRNQTDPCCNCCYLLGSQQQFFYVFFFVPR